MIKVVSFYSFKGGVGRTLALAHFAKHLARNGKKVVALDLDLEAPGLHYKFLSRSGGGREIKRGFVDYIYHIAVEYGGPQPIEPFLIDVPLENSSDGWLKLFPAGASPKNSYWKKLLDIDWRVFFYGDYRIDDDGIGLTALWDLRTRMEEEIQADYLLIDCRTGLTELGGVTLSHLSDAIVGFIAHSLEQWEGARAVLRSAYRLEQRPDGLPPPELFVALCRIPGDTITEDNMLAADFEALVQPTSPSDWGDEPELDALALPLKRENILILHSEPSLQVVERLFEPEEDLKLNNDYKKLFILIAPEVGGEVVIDIEISVDALRERGLQFFASGNYGQARAFLDQAFTLSRKDLGPEHPHTLSCMSNLAATLQAQGDLAGARAWQEDVLATSRKALGLEHPHTLSSMNNLASTLGALGDLVGARALQEEVLALQGRVLGPEHPNTLTSMHNLASTLRDLGDRAGARALQEEVLELSRKVLGPEHPHTLSSMNNLALTLGALGDRAGARALQEEVLDLSRKVLGPEHPHTLSSMNNLALTLGALGDHAGAKDLQEEVLALQRKVLGPEHPHTLASMNNLASALGALGDRAGAKALQEEVLAQLRKVLGPEHPHTLTSMNNLASTLGVLGDLTRARALLEEVLPLQRKVLGLEHPNTLTSMDSLAGILFDLGEKSQACTLMQEAWELRQKVLGPQHPDAQKSKSDLEDMKRLISQS